MEAVVYFVKVEGKDTFKIGYTESDPHQRLSAIQTYCPFPVTLYGVNHTSKPRELESLLHRQFDEHKTSGEWFNVPVETINGLLIHHESGTLVSRKKVRINLNICPHCGQDMPSNQSAVSSLSIAKTNGAAKKENLKRVLVGFAKLIIATTY